MVTSILLSSDFSSQGTIFRDASRLLLFVTRHVNTFAWGYLMKQPEDFKTIEMDLGVEVLKRGRGRPSKLDALTPAERSKRYRDAKRGQPKETSRKS